LIAAAKHGQTGLGGDGYLDIILLALVAGFILLRLRSVLGRRTGFEQTRRPPEPAPSKPAKPDEDNVIALPEPNRAESALDAPPPTSPVSIGLGRIKAADRSFSDAEFGGGAKAAYEMIVTAFAAGDTTTLKTMVSPDVMAGFTQAIEARRKAGETHETIVNSIRSATIVDADLKGSVAEVTIRFVSELVNVTRDAKGDVVSGEASAPGKPGAVEDVTDVWTFSRDTKSPDPNWTLVDTSASA